MRLAQNTGRRSFPSSLFARSLARRYHGRRRPVVTLSAGSVLRFSTGLAIWASVKGGVSGFVRWTREVAESDHVQMTNFEEGLGRVMYVVGALEYEGLFPGSAVSLWEKKERVAKVRKAHKVGKIFFCKFYFISWYHSFQFQIVRPDYVER